MPLPDNLNTPTEDPLEITKRTKSVFWKIKGIIAKITFKLFAQYTDENINFAPEIKQFTTHF